MAFLLHPVHPLWPDSRHLSHSVAPTCLHFLIFSTRHFLKPMNGCIWCLAHKKCSTNFWSKTQFDNPQPRQRSLCPVVLCDRCFMSLDTRRCDSQPQSSSHIVGTAQRGCVFLLSLLVSYSLTRNPRQWRKHQKPEKPHKTQKDQEEMEPSRNLRAPTHPQCKL